MKNEEKTTTYTASDLPEEIHSEEPEKDAEIVKNVERESETTESEIVESGSTESEVAEAAEDTEVKGSESATETTEAEEPGEKKTTTEATTEATTEDDSEDSEKGGFTRGKLIKIFAMEVLAFVIFIFSIIAWFTMNDDVSTTGMRIMMSAPGDILLSVGQTRDVAMNDPNDALVLSGGAVVSPDVDDSNDWANSVSISNYYTFGKMIPASSDTGKNIFFTPDATGNGRYLKSGAEYYQADGVTDGQLRAAAGKLETGETAASYPSLAKATSHPLAYDTSTSTKEEADNWLNDPSSTGYKKKTAWYDTNDDGYYVDIPIWFKSAAASETKLKVEGIVKEGPGSQSNSSGNSAGQNEGNEGSGESSNSNETNDRKLYRAVRVAILKEETTGNVTQLVPAVAEASDDKYHNILPLLDKASFETAGGNSILDSNNYTVTRESVPVADRNKHYGVSAVPSTSNPTYTEYLPYDASVTDLNEVAVIPADGSYVKRIIRIWLDGEDQDCWNPNAGQNWIISLQFTKIE